jgi:hypothetical protein
MSVAYDAGALIAAERNERDFWADHRRLLARGHRPVTTAPIVAQASRSPSQALLHRLVKACAIVSFDEVDAHDVGRLLARSGTSDVVDAHLVLVAGRLRARVVTADVGDIEHLSANADTPVPVRGI